MLHPSSSTGKVAFLHTSVMLTMVMLVLTQQELVGVMCFRLLLLCVSFFSPFPRLYISRKGKAFNVGDVIFCVVLCMN